MKILIDQAEIIELITAHVHPIIGDKPFDIVLIPARGVSPMSAEIVITTESTVASTIAQHVGSDVKIEPIIEPEPEKKTRRNRKQMVRDGDAKNVTAAEQKEVDDESRAEKDLEAAGKPDATVNAIKTGIETQISGPEDPGDVDPEAGVDSLHPKELEPEKVIVNAAADSLFNKPVV
jgi:hypothetical protein